MENNMDLWRKVEKTDPKHTKKVNQRGGFTAISAHYQIMRATEVFGPIGQGWGYYSGAPIISDGVILVPVTVWHGSRDNEFGPVLGGAELKDKNGRMDSDAGKKAGTDALTKCLSQLGFNADVFLGKFDDNKYVAQVAKEFSETTPGTIQGEAIDNAWRDGILDSLPQDATPRMKAEAFAKFFCDDFKDKGGKALENRWTRYQSTIEQIAQRHPDLGEKIVDAFENRKNEITENARAAERKAA